MQVFKFGGASVKDAEAVRNVKRILEEFGTRPLVVIFSAMGKMTNALERVLNAWWHNEEFAAKLEVVKSYHFDILAKLIPNQSDPVWEDLKSIFNKLETYLQKPPKKSYDIEYDYIVSHGEIVSTKIVSAYLNNAGFLNKWIDARDFVITTNLHREARVKWDITERLISTYIPQMAEVSPVITQGFIGSTGDDVTTTLGREGSDFTASIFAYCLNADELVIWKDVPGILNADPKKFSNTVKFESLSYHDAAEMTYYGASVLHPKTIKPLQNKNIPLRVRSFVEPAKQGTIVQSIYQNTKSNSLPIIISKESQVLVSLSTRDYSFIAEESIEKIFDEVVKYGIKVNVMHNTAISFLMCIDDRSGTNDEFMKALEEEFEITKNSGLELITVKYPAHDTLEKITSAKKIWLELRSGDTVQYIIG